MLSSFIFSSLWYGDAVFPTWIYCPWGRVHVILFYVHQSVKIPGKEEYLYLGAIDFIKSLKKGAAFGECCPMLNDIAQLPSWKKVNTGMQRLYEGKTYSF